MTAIIGPAISAVVTLLGWLLAQSRDDHGLPRRGRVRFGSTLALFGVLLALTTLPTSLDPLHYSVSLALVLLVGLVLVRGAGRLALGFTTTAETITSAAWLSWTSTRRAVCALGALVAGLGLATWLAGQGWTLAGLLGGLVAMAPTRWHLPSGAAREHNRTDVEVAVAGAFRGGAEWDSREAEQRGAPITTRFRGDDQPCLVTAPLPPSWRATSLEADRAELRERLSAWGSPWMVSMDSSRRRLRAVLCDPLPTLLSVPKDRTLRWIEENKPSALALYLGEAQDANTGEAFPLWWDADNADPHALIGGKTKKGKTVGLRLLVGQAIARGWDVIIIDPKGVDFVWAGRLPGVRYFPGKDCLDGLAEAVGEMDERQTWLQHNLWTGGNGSDEEGDLLKVPRQPYKPCLVIVDEAAEASGLGDSAEQKQTAERLSKLARLSRFGGMICAFCTQRPDVKFIAGEARENLGIRVLYGAAGHTLTQMVLEMSLKDLGKLTSQCRGRGRAVVVEGNAIEFQGAFISPRTVKDLRGVLPADKLTKMRFAPEPEWRTWVRKGKRPEEMDPSVLKHPDYDRVAAELDARMAEMDAAAEAAESSGQDDGEQTAKRDSKSRNRGRQPTSETESASAAKDDESGPSDQNLSFDLSEFE